MVVNDGNDPKTQKQTHTHTRMSYILYLQLDCLRLSQ